MNSCCMQTDVYHSSFPLQQKGSEYGSDNDIASHRHFGKQDEAKTKVHLYEDYCIYSSIWFNPGLWI